MISVSCNIKDRQTILVWKDGLKELRQRGLDEVLNAIKMEAIAEMIGDAVPLELAKAIARQVKFLLKEAGY